MAWRTEKLQMPIFFPILGCFFLSFFLMYLFKSCNDLRATLVVLFVSIQPQRMKLSFYFELCSLVPSHTRRNWWLENRGFTVDTHRSRKQKKSNQARRFARMNKTISLPARNTFFFFFLFTHRSAWANFRLIFHFFFSLHRQFFSFVIYCTVIVTVDPIFCLVLF